MGSMVTKLYNLLHYRKKYKELEEENDNLHSQLYELEKIIPQNNRHNCIVFKITDFQESGVNIEAFIENNFKHRKCVVISRSDIPNVVSHIVDINFPLEKNINK